MKLDPRKIFSGGGRRRRVPVLLAVTPPRKGERTLLGVENLLGSIAIPEPFSLEMAGDADGVTLMARCIDREVVRGQIAVRYPQARIAEVQAGDDPLLLREGEQAWGMTLRSGGPDQAPLRTFRDDDLLDPGLGPPDGDHRGAVLSASRRAGGGPAVAAVPGAGLGRGPPGAAPEGWHAAAGHRGSGRTAGQPRGGRGPEDGDAGPGRAGGPEGLFLGTGRRGLEGRAARTRVDGRPGHRRLGVGALEGVARPGVRPAADQGEGVAHRL